jgi:peroxiredoxin (alkyl hydroperoxide reductase subunit C)
MNFQQRVEELEDADTQVLGVSMDSPFANKAFAEKLGVTFPLLSDWGGDVARKYGVYQSQRKVVRRASFLIDKEGMVTKIQLDSDAIDPSALVEACILE